MTPGGEWATPWDVFRYIEKNYLRDRFDYDLCATSKNSKCRRYFSIDNPPDSRSVSNKNCWMNPPYTRGVTGRFLKIASDLAKHQGCTVAVLLPTICSSAEYFRTYVGEYEHERKAGSIEIYFYPKRIRFLDEDGRPGKTPNFSSMVVIFRA